jgi:hypothetical protein
MSTYRSVGARTLRALVSPWSDRKEPYMPFIRATAEDLSVSAAQFRQDAPSGWRNGMAA